MAHVQVQQVFSHSFQYKYHHPKFTIQSPVLHAVLGDLNPLFLDDKSLRDKKMKGGEVSMFDMSIYADQNKYEMALPQGSPAWWKCQQIKYTKRMHNSMAGAVVLDTAYWKK
jgi:hypothetical protein